MKKLVLLSAMAVMLSSLVAMAQPPDTLWTKVYGGSGDDECSCVDQTSDGGFIFVGTYCDVSTYHRYIWLIKTDANGDTLWSRLFNGAVNSYGHSVEQTTDNGFIIVGSVASSNGSKNIWLIKTNASGDTL